MTALMVTTAAVDYDLATEVGTAPHDDGHIYLRSDRLSFSLRLTPDEAARLRDQLTHALGREAKSGHGQ